MRATEDSNLNYGFGPCHSQVTGQALSFVKRLGKDRCLPQHPVVRVTTGETNRPYPGPKTRAWKYKNKNNCTSWRSILKQTKKKNIR